MESRLNRLKRGRPKRAACSLSGRRGQAGTALHQGSRLTHTAHLVAAALRPFDNKEASEHLQHTPRGAFL